MCPSPPSRRSAHVAAQVTHTIGLSPFLRRSLLGAALFFGAGLLLVHPDSAPVFRSNPIVGPRCDRLASPAGSDDSGDGGRSRPYRTLTRLDASLAPGQTGCLRSGTYGGLDATHTLSRDGSPTAPITVTAYPKEQPTVVGWVDIEASYTVLSGLQIDGSNRLYVPERPDPTCAHRVSRGLTINGTHDVFEHNDFSQSAATLRGNGIGVGFNRAADETTLRYNRIHDVGGCRAFDHLIYLAAGKHVQIYGNWLWNDPHGWGVQVFPKPSGAHIYANVVDRAGSGFFLGASPATSDNRLDHNVVVNSTGLPDAGLRTGGVAVSSYWSVNAGTGTGNSFDHNDSFANSGGLAQTTGVALDANTTANPHLADTEAHDYRVPTSSAVAGWGLWDGGSP